MSSSHYAKTGFVALILILNLIPASSYAQENNVMLEFQPHCQEADRTACPRFETADGSHLKTALLKAGDLLDIDVVLTNGTNKGLEAFQAWLNYDAKVLEGRSVTLTDAVKEPSPGEQNIVNSLQLVKIGGSLNPVNADQVVLARITFRVVTATKDTVISFHNYLPDGTGQTAVNGAYKVIGSDHNNGLPLPPCKDTSIIGCRGAPTPLLNIEPSKLTVALEDLTPKVETVHAADIGATQSSKSGTSIPLAGSVTTPAISSSSESLTSTTDPLLTATQDPSLFALLQVQNLKVTTRDTQIFLAWDPLNSSALAGYNVYYGTVSGRYIQRRSVPASATSMILRDLVPDTTYFLAIKGVNQSNQETVFSQEVSVTVGRPDTSSSPLTYSEGTTPPPPVENSISTRGGKEVTGSTGTDSIILYLALASAFIGTLFASARQYSLLRNR